MSLVCLRRLYHSHTRICAIRSPHHSIPTKQLATSPTSSSGLRIYANLRFRYINRPGPHLLYSTLQNTQQGPEVPQEAPKQRRKSKRPPAAKTSLRRVAVEAETSRHGNSPNGDSFVDLPATKTVTACCGAEEYDIPAVAQILKDHGYAVDPWDTGLYPQVVHIEIPMDSSASASTSYGDLFVFPSGTLVAWGVAESTLSLLTTTLLPAAQNYYAKFENLEKEDLEYLIDPKRDNSSIKGDTIILGTKRLAFDDGIGDETKQTNNVDTIFAKIAFSSGLANSTKLAVLETLLDDYFESTKSIPADLSRGRRIRFTRSEILQKTGQLLSVRAQLNLYSELTDSLPDLFWDSKHELGLEGYYDQVGRALDINIRIKTLNQKMDYAQEIASVLHEQLKEQHGLRLEWIIIILIAIEVAFGTYHIAKERHEAIAKEQERNLQTRQ